MAVPATMGMGPMLPLDGPHFLQHHNTQPRASILHRLKLTHKESLQRLSQRLGDDLERARKRGRKGPVERLEASKRRTDGLILFLGAEESKIPPRFDAGTLTRLGLEIEEIVNPSPGGSGLASFGTRDATMPSGTGGQPSDLLGALVFGGPEAAVRQEQGAQAPPEQRVPAELAGNIPLVEDAVDWAIDAAINNGVAWLSQPYTATATGPGN